MRPPAGGQTYVERPPIPALAGVVSSVWIQQVAPDAAPYLSRAIPNGSVELVCDLKSMPRLTGPLTRPARELLAPGTDIVGVRFVPGAAPAVLGLPASELVDQTVAIEDVWERAALEDAIAGAPSPEHALTALQTRLAARLAAPPDPLVAEAVRQLMPWRIEDVGSLTASLYISETQLRRRCHAAVGLAPKVLHRMLRFQGFLALVQHAMAQGRPPDDDGLVRLAAEAGYADQPHLNRECVRLTGVPPRAFLGEAAATCACGHDHAASFAPVLRSRPR